MTEDRSLAAPVRADALPRNRLRFRRLLDCEAAVIRCTRDRARHRVIRDAREIRRGEQHLLLRALQCLDADEFELSARECARLVHGHHGDAREIFDRRATAEKHAVARTERNRGEDRRRHREHERAGRHHHEQRHRAVKCALVRLLADERRRAEREPPHEENSRADAEHDRRVARAEAVREPLHGRLEILRIFDEPDDALERAVLRCALHTPLDHAPQVQRARQAGVAGDFRNWLGLAGEHRLVARALAALHEDVHGHLFVRRHAHMLAGGQFRDGHFSLDAILDQPRELRRIFQQRADLALRAPVRETLHRARCREKEQQHRGLALLADEHRAERDEPHEKIRAELAHAHAGPDLCREIPSAREIGDRDARQGKINVRLAQQQRRNCEDKAHGGTHGDPLPITAFVTLSRFHAHRICIQI